MAKRCTRFKMVKGKGGKRVRRCASFSGRASQRVRARSKRARARAATRGSILVCFPQKPGSKCKSFASRNWRGALNYARIGSQYSGCRNVYQVVRGRRQKVRVYCRGKKVMEKGFF